MHTEEEVLPDLCVLKCENHLWASAQSTPSPFSLPTQVLPTWSVLLKSTSYLRPLLTRLTILSFGYLLQVKLGLGVLVTETNSPGKSKIQEGSGGRGAGKSCGLTTHMGYILKDDIVNSFNNI